MAFLRMDKGDHELQAFLNRACKWGLTGASEASSEVGVSKVLSACGLSGDSWSPVRS